jgi:hypothetical protein
MAGGGEQGERNEDGLDKGKITFKHSQLFNWANFFAAVDFVQEKFLGGGQQSNETAAEQAKDEAISDTIRDQYKSATGKEFFISDKDKKYGA